MAYHKRLLYPLFQFYCKKLGVPAYNQRRFSADIIDALKSVLNVSYVKKVRKQEGILITGIQLRRDFMSNSVLSGSLPDHPFHPEEEVSQEMSNSPSDAVEETSEAKGQHVVNVANVATLENFSENTNDSLATEVESEESQHVVNVVNVATLGKTSNISVVTRKGSGKGLPTRSTYISSQDNPPPLPRPLIDPDGNFVHPVVVAGKTISAPTHPRINRDLYNDYLGLLDHGDIASLNTHFYNFITSNYSEEECLNIFKELDPIPKTASEAFIKNSLHQNKLGYDKILRGIAVKDFELKSGARLFPINPRLGNSAKKEIRTWAFKQVLNIPEIIENQYDILDVDIKSCFVSLSLGLFPKQTTVIARALQNYSSMWDFIKEEFQNMGKADAYDRTAVKACVYSSFFGGSSKAMLEGLSKNLYAKIGWYAFRSSTRP